MKASKLEIGINCFAPIIIGLSIYLCFRTLRLNVFNWFNAFGLSGLVTFLRCHFGIFQKFLPNWIVNSLPDGLWAYSFIYSINLIWNKRETGYWFWLLTSCVIILIPEILQYFKITNGTFDVLDLILLVMGILLSTIITSSKNNLNEKNV